MKTGEIPGTMVLQVAGGHDGCLHGTVSFVEQSRTASFESLLELISLIEGTLPLAQAPGDWKPTRTVAEGSAIPRVEARHS